MSQNATSYVWVDRRRYFIIKVAVLISTAYVSLLLFMTLINPYIYHNYTINVRVLCIA